MSGRDIPLPATGQGTESLVDAKGAARARSLANLRPPFRKGETGNPRGINGRRKAAEVVRFLDEPFDGDKTRFRVLLEAAFKRALSGNRGSDATIRTLIEHYAGRARISTEELALQVAEHFRQVERDRLDVSLKMLGDRVKTWGPERIKQFFADCARDPRGFLFAAEEHITESPRPGPPQASPPAELAAPEQPTEPLQATHRQSVLDATPRVELPEDEEGEA